MSSETIITILLCLVAAFVLMCLFHPVFCREVSKRLTRHASGLEAYYRTVKQKPKAKPQVDKLIRLKG